MVHGLSGPDENDAESLAMRANSQEAIQCANLVDADLLRFFFCVPCAESTSGSSCSSPPGSINLKSGWLPPENQMQGGAFSASFHASRSLFAQKAWRPGTKRIAACHLLPTSQKEGVGQPPDLLGQLVPDFSVPRVYHYL
ncbi:MAG: hypothetical protein M5R42_09785 [Rhodocyclaceae bacterium]|nr:hypothetical protein [Rhodocyclaceae bacterium]